MNNQGTGADGRALLESNSNTAPVPIPRHLPSAGNQQQSVAVLCSLLFSPGSGPKAINLGFADPRPRDGKVPILRPPLALLQKPDWDGRATRLAASPSAGSSLRLNDIDMDARRLFIHNSKERKDRIAYMSDTVALAVQQHLSFRSNQVSVHLFSTHNGVLHPRS